MKAFTSSSGTLLKLHTDILYKDTRYSVFDLNQLYLFAE